MAFDLYGPQATSTLYETAAAERNKMQERATRLFGNKEAMNLYQEGPGEVNMNTIKAAIYTFGVETLSSDKLDEAILKLDQEIEDNRQKLMQARLQNDMELYQRRLDLQVRLREMRSEARMAKKIRLGDFLTSIGIAVGTILGAYLGTKDLFPKQPKIVEQTTENIFETATTTTAQPFYPTYRDLWWRK